MQSTFPITIDYEISETCDSKEGGKVSLTVFPSKIIAHVSYITDACIQYFINVQINSSQKLLDAINAVFDSIIYKLDVNHYNQIVLRSVEINGVMLKDVNHFSETFSNVYDNAIELENSTPFFGFSFQDNSHKGKNCIRQVDTHGEMMSVFQGFSGVYHPL